MLLWSRIFSENYCVLTSILARIVHGRHPGTLLTRGGLLQRIVDDVGQSVFLIILQHVSINVIIDTHTLC